MIKSNGGIIGPDNVTTGGSFGSASGVFKLGEVTKLIRESKWPTAGPQGYNVDNSVRMSGATVNLQRDFSGNGNRRTFTFSTWFKLSKITQSGFFNWGKANPEFSLRFESATSNLANNYFRVSQFDGSQPVDLVTTQFFADSSAWGHMVVAFDTTQGTASNRIKVYFNGTQITSLGTATYPSQNFETFVNQASKKHYIGYSDYQPINGYLSETVFIDGQQLAPTSFGEFNSQTGIWVPKDVSGLTFGTNGYYLQYKEAGTSQNSSGIGADTSGNNNHFACDGVVSLDQSTDTCTTNFATLMHPGYSDGGNVWQNILSEGNLFGASTSGGYSNYIGTIGLSTGKWYWETKVTLSAATNANSGTGIKSAEYTQRSAWQSGSGSYYLSTTGDIGNATTPGTSYGSAISSGNIVGVAYDATNGVIWFSINGTWQNSATISEIEAGTTTNAAFSSIASGTYLPFGTDATASRTFDYGFNFGSPFYAISSGNADSNGFGNFEYAVPTGFLSLNTKNLAAVLA